MSDRQKLLAALKAAAWALAAECGARAAEDALDAVKREISDADWSRR
jgi:hypothetical protein